MLTKLLEYLNVREEERTQVLLMLAAGFFMGIFLATYSVVAESLFLNTLGDQLNQAFFYSGMFGIAATSIFSFAQTRIKFSNLTSATIILIVGLTTFFYVGYHFGPAKYQEPIIFTMFCMMGPITTVLLLSYWGVFGRLFNFRQSKRIIGWIDTGQLTAVILANLLIPITADLFFGETDNYLIVCAISIIISASFFIAISLKYPLAKNDPWESDRSVIKEAGIIRVIRDPYTKLLSIFLVVSMVMLILGQFTFQELIKVQYPDQLALTKFLAFFNAAIFGLSFIMQTFVNDRIVSNYGIRVALMLVPIIVGFFALCATFSGVYFGYTPEMTDKFLFFFLFVALIRLFNNMIRDSLENPMFKLLFIPLDNRSRFGIQSKVEGVVNESGRFAAGAIIIGFATMASFKIIWMPIIILMLVSLYFLVIQKMYAGYKSKIKAKLEAAQSSAEKLELGTERITRRLEAQLLGPTPGTSVFSFKLLEKIDPEGANKWVNMLIRNERPEVHSFAQRRMNELKGLSVSERYIIKYDQSRAQVSDKNLLNRSELEMLIKSGGNITKSRLVRLARSQDAGDRQYAAELLLHTNSEENTSYLIELLSDSDPNVRKTAMKTAIKKSSPEVIRALIDNLAYPAYSNQAADSLVVIGGKALNILDSAFYRTGQSTAVLNSIVQIIGYIGGQHAKEILWNKIDFPDKVVVSKVLLALGEAGFRANSAQSSRIRYAIENDIGDISWNLCAIDELGSSGFAKDIKEALRNEISNDVDHVYMLLAMLYDARSIQLVKENIESGTVEGTAFAVELLDVFLSDQLKQRVIPCIDELSDQERIRRLEVFYPRVQLDEKLVLKFLINREFTQTNRWTKACVLRQIGTERISEFNLDLIAQLFNPDPLVREMAAWALYQIDPREYESNMERLGMDLKRQMDTIILPGQAHARLSVLDKVLFFKNLEIFKGISGLELSFLADAATEQAMNANESIVVDEKANAQFYIVYRGEVEYYERTEMKRAFSQGEFIGEMPNIPGYLNSNLLVSRQGAILLRLGKEHLYDLMASNVKLAEQVLDYV
ncbi:MAG: HEAT repeat domain-containing protein [Cyclobacteriaceae bacterium]|nr:HEAT repeat domain-containing protein [Cyclobacteriaceae bacterium]